MTRRVPGLQRSNTLSEEPAPDCQVFWIKPKLLRPLKMQRFTATLKDAGQRAFRIMVSSSLPGMPLPLPDPSPPEHTTGEDEQARSLIDPA